MSVVIDASSMVAFLIDGGPDGQWAEEVVLSQDLVAPHLLPVEVASTLRRSSAMGLVGPESASLAHQDLFGLDLELFPYEPFAERTWQLRENLTSCDAWYVALAEALGTPLVTLDRRLASVPGVRCEVLVPPTDPGHPA